MSGRSKDLDALAIYTNAFNFRLSPHIPGPGKLSPEAERGKVFQMEVERFIGQVSEPYDLIAVDPPYADPAIVDTLELLSASAAVGAGTVVLLGHWPRLEIPERIGRLELLRQRCHGDSCFAIFEVPARSDDAGNNHDH